MMLTHKEESCRAYANIIQYFRATITDSAAVAGYKPIGAAAVAATATAAPQTFP